MQMILGNSDYTFVASTKKITLVAPFDTLDEERILRITNLTTRAIIYDSERRMHSISVVSGVITHTYDATGMANDDKLQIIVDVVEQGLTPFVHETLSVTDSATSLTSDTYLDATCAEMTLEIAEIRIWADGTAPTATVGKVVNVSDEIVLNSAAQIAGFKAIRTGSTSGTLSIQYFH